MLESLNMDQALGIGADTAPFVRPHWPAPANVHGLISTRQGGVSQAPFASLNVGLHVGDDVEAVRQNRARVQAQVQYPLAYLNQTHSTMVVSASAALAALATGTPLNADASIARQGEAVACAVMTADCLPVLLCDYAGSVVAAVHAGWRGLAGGVIQNTIEAMAVPPAEIMAYLGPAIGPDAFEVGQDVYDAFCQCVAEADKAFVSIGTQHYLADIYALARYILADMGIHRVFGGTECTVLQRQQFFSYRRDGQTGRMVSAIWLT